MSTEHDRPKRRGRPSRISRDQIISVARKMDPTTLTMRAVAAELGVDPSAVNYHVSDKGKLLELVATDVVRSEIEDVSVPKDADWRDIVWIFADSLRRAVVRSGSHSPYFRFPSGDAANALEIVDRLLDCFTTAGLDTTEAIRAITSINQITFAAAREAVLAGRSRGHPQVPEMRRALGQLEPGQLPRARELIDAWAPESDEQFAYNIHLVIAGIEARLNR